MTSAQASAFALQLRRTLLDFEQEMVESARRSDTRMIQSLAGAIRLTKGLIRSTADVERQLREQKV